MDKAGIFLAVGQALLSFISLRIAGFVIAFFGKPAAAIAVLIVIASFFVNVDKVFYYAKTAGSMGFEFLYTVSTQHLITVIAALIGFFSGIVAGVKK